MLRNFIVLFGIALSFTTLKAQVNTPKTGNDSLILSSKEYNFRNCAKPKLPLFNLPVNEILELEIKTDFQKIFETTRSEQSRIKGILSYTLNGNKFNLPIRIKARGKTRFEFCRFKPLDIKFPSSVDSTIFQGLETKLLITTHCGEKEGNQWILEGTRSEHQNRLLAEYYIYSMLETLETTTQSVSLCKLKYINSNDSLLAEEFAFIMEDDDDVAARCNLLPNTEKVNYLDESSLLNAHLINQFITNYDWEYEFTDSIGWIGHNLKFLESTNNIAYMLPYDFDLNAIVFPDYWKNKSESFNVNCDLFQEMLNTRFSDKNKLAAPYNIYINIPYMIKMIEESYMDEQYKEKFTHWINSFEYILKNHLSQYRKYKRLLY